MITYMGLQVYTEVEVFGSRAVLASMCVFKYFSIIDGSDISLGLWIFSH
jgi:hypothetical protein